MLEGLAMRTAMLSAWHRALPAPNLTAVDSDLASPPANRTSQALRAGTWTVDTSGR